MDNDDLEKTFYKEMRQHAERHLRTPAMQPFHYDIRLYYMSIYQVFSRLDSDTQRLINLLLRRRSEYGALDGQFQYWDLVVLQRPPYSGAAGRLSRRRCWRWRRQYSVSDFRLILRQLQNE